MPSIARSAAALLLLTACKKPAPPPEMPVRFCDQDLTGLWLNSSDKHFAYRLRDHGGVLRGEFLERAEDGGMTPPSDPVTFELHRTNEALAGVMRTTGPSPNGRICPVEYGIKVTGCQPEGVQAVVETVIQVTDDCKRLEQMPDGGPIPPELAEFHFERLHPSDGGETLKAH